MRRARAIKGDGIVFVENRRDNEVGAGVTIAALREQAHLLLAVNGSSVRLSHMRIRGDTERRRRSRRTRRWLPFNLDEIATHFLEE